MTQHKHQETNTQTYQNDALYKENYRFFRKHFYHIISHLETSHTREDFYITGTPEKRNLNLYLSGLKYYEKNAYIYAKKRTTDAHINNLFDDNVSFINHQSNYDTAYPALMSMISRFKKITPDFWHSPHKFNQEKNKKHIAAWGIVYGIGLGLHLPLIIKQRKVKNLIVCDQNPTMLRASMHVISWEKEVYDVLKKNDCDLYIVIGDSEYHPAGPVKENAQRAFFKKISSYIYEHPHAPLRKGAFLHTHNNNPLLEETLKTQADHIRYNSITLHGSDVDEYIMNINSYTNILNPNGCYFKEPYLTSFPKLDLPIFIIGSAPSLQNDLDFIKENQDKAIIIACSTGIVPLVKKGIKPDFYTQLENVPTISMASNLMQAQIKIPEETISMFTNSVAPYASHPFKKHIIIPRATRSGFFTKETLQTNTSPSYTKSVAPFSLDVAMQWNAPYIVLFGIDISVKNKKMHHIKDSHVYTDNPWKKIIGQSSFPNKHKNVVGETVYSNATLDDIHEDIEQTVIRHLTSKQHRNTVLNCSTGRHILGTKHGYASQLKIETPKHPKSYYIQQIQDLLKPSRDKKENIAKITKQSYEVYSTYFKKILTTIDNVQSYDDLYNLPFNLTKIASDYPSEDRTFGLSIHMESNMLALFVHTYVDNIPREARTEFKNNIKKSFKESLTATFNMINLATQKYL